MGDIEFVEEHREDEAVEVSASASEVTESSVVELIDDSEQQFRRKLREGS